MGSFSGDQHPQCQITNGRQSERTDSIKPTLLPKKPQQPPGEQRHEGQRAGIGIPVTQLRHVLEVHPPKAGHERQWQEDGRDHGQYGQPMVQLFSLMVVVTVTQIHQSIIMQLNKNAITDGQVDETVTAELRKMVASLKKWEG